MAAAAVVLMAFVVSGQNPPGFNYNPYLYYPYTALQPPVQETHEVAAARAAHMAALAAASARVVAPAAPVVSSAPVVVVGPPVAAQPVSPIPDTPDVWNAKVEHWRAHSTAAAANGVVSSLPPLVPVNHGAPQPVVDTPEVQAARADFMRAYNEALTRSG